MFSSASLKGVLASANARILKPFAGYIAKNKWLFAALAYSVLLHLIECLSHCRAGISNSWGNPFIQGLWGYLALFGLCLLAGGLPAKILLTVVLALQTAVGFLAIFLSAVFALTLDADAFVVLSASSHQEVREFISRFYTWKLAVWTAVTVAVFAAVLWSVWISKLKRQWPLYALCGILIAPQLINTIRFTIKGDYVDIYKNNPLFSLIADFTKFNARMAKLAAMERDPQPPPNIRYLGADDHLLAVVVIGESATRFHHSVYGYPRPTNPELGAKEIYPFTDVISGYAHTVQAMCYMLSTADVEHQEDFRYAMFDVFKGAGFDIRLYSNQARWDKYSSPTTMLTAHADTRYYQQEHFANSFDDQLVKEFERQPPKYDRPTLAVFHLIGSHTGFEKRTPEDRKVFSAADRPVSPYKIDDWNDVDEYDNSIRFTDHMLGELVRIVDRHPGPAFLLYCSDHGEFPESAQSRPRSGASKDPEYYEIPFVFYANAAYREKYPEVMAAIRRNLDQPFVTDHFMYPVFTAARITFDGFPHRNDLFSPDFVPRTNRRLGNSDVIYRSRKNPYSAPRPAKGK